MSSNSELERVFSLPLQKKLLIEEYHTELNDILRPLDPLMNIKIYKEKSFRGLIIYSK